MQWCRKKGGIVRRGGDSHIPADPYVDGVVHERALRFDPAFQMVAEAGHRVIIRGEIVNHLIPNDLPHLRPVRQAPLCS